MAAPMPIVGLIRGRLFETGWVMLWFLIAGVILSGFAFPLIILLHALRESLFGETARCSRARALVYGLCSAFLLPAGGFVLLWTATGDVALAGAHFQSLSWLALLMPVLLLVIGKGIDKEIRCRQEWESLEIGQ